MEDIWSLSDEDLNSRFTVLQGENAELHTIIGAFIHWFSEVELQIDRNICHLIGLRANFELYGFIAQKLSHKRKFEVLREFLTRRGKERSKIGGNLHARLSDFEVECIKRRNQIAHSHIEVRGRKLYFGSPYQMIDLKPVEVRPGRIVPQFITYDDVRRITLWMHDFWRDLGELAEQTWQQPLPQKFEIASPRSGPLGTANRKAKSRRESKTATRRKRLGKQP